MKNSLLKNSFILDPDIMMASEDLGYKKGDISISYSQFSTYLKCPKSWELKNIKKIKEDKPSIHMVFGNAMHSVIQTYFKVMYTKTIKAADELDYKEMLKTQLREEYAKDKAKHGYNFTTPQELSEFYEDGLEIINYLKKKRATYIESPKDWVLVGIEIPLCLIPDKNRPTVRFTAYLDIVFRTKTKPYRYKVIDFKTSTNGWKEWDKKDKGKIAQVILYKKFFADQYGVKEDQIDVSFLILKRKLQLESMYPQRRLQKFEPAQGTRIVKQTIQTFTDWVEACFDQEGQYATDHGYLALAGTNFKNCKFCPYNENEELCPKSKRITEI